MIVPEHWAEARLQERRDGRQVTVRRFGWSDVGPAEAEVHAQARAQEALERIFAGEPLPRREQKQAYGEVGLPIREEILARDGMSVITRNAYGAHCLNTPDVLFADVDFEVPAVSRKVMLRTWLACLLPIAAVTIAKGWWLAGVVAALLALGFAEAVARRLAQWRLRVQGGAEVVAIRRVHAFAAAHPDWHLRVYRTPAGLRVLALHRTFDPAGDEAADCFRAIGVDPVYAAMCRQQRCFRARLTGKPWRMGIADPMRPRPGVWPVHPERRPLRDAWVQAYEAKAVDYAACRFMEALGATDVVHPTAALIRDLHDRASGARSDRPLA